MAGSVTIEGTIATVPPGSATISTTLTPSTANLVQIQNQILASGANTITVPTWSVGVLIEPAPTNTIALTLKGVTGDTGVAISPVNATLLSWPASPPANFVITAASVTTTQTTLTFF